MKWKQLKTKHKSYNKKQIDRLDLLYIGGYDIMDQSSLFLTKLTSESNRAFDDRLKAAAYMPIFSNKIDFYTSMLLSQQLKIDEDTNADDPSTPGGMPIDDDPYKLFQKNADMHGKSLVQFLADAEKQALIHTMVWVGVDFPAPDEKPINALEEEVMQTSRPYTFLYDQECVWDWKLADDGFTLQWIKFAWDVVVQDNPIDIPKHYWLVQTKELTDDGMKDTHYRSKDMEMRVKISDEDDLMVEVQPATSFKEINVIPHCVPAGLAIGNKIGPMCEEIFQRSSCLSAATSKSMNAIPLIFLGPEANAPGGAALAEVAENPLRGYNVKNDWQDRGFGILAADDKAEMLEPHGHAFVLVDSMISRKILQIDETLCQMGMSQQHKSAGTNPASAKSQKENRHALEIFLTSLGDNMKDFIIRLFTCISSARGESIVWTVSGLDNFKLDDRDQVIAEAVLFPGLAAQAVSPTFQKLYVESFYHALLGDNASQEEMAAIHNEIQTADFSKLLPPEPVVAAPMGGGKPGNKPPPKK